MIVFLYIYFILNLIVGISFYVLSKRNIANIIIDKIKERSNEHLLVITRRSIGRSIIGILFIIILMILFL